MERSARVRNVLVAIALTISVVGTAIGASAQPVSLTVWDISVSEAYTKWWKAYVDRFNQKQSRIQVRYETFDTEPYKTKLRSALVAGTAADVFFFFPGAETTIAFREGRIRAMDDVLDKARLTPQAVGRCSVGQQLVCLPLFLAPSVVYYNKQLFAKAGVDPAKWADPRRPTWAEFLAASDALKQARIVPIAAGNKDKWPLMHWYWALQNRYGGTRALDAAIFGTGGGKYESPSFVKAGELTRDIVQRGYLSPGFNGVGGVEKYTMFTRGQAAMTYMGPWMLARVQEAAAEGFEYGVFHFPSVTDGDPDSQTDIMAGVDAYFVAATTKHPDAVREFLAGFLEDETATSFMVDTKNISVVQGVVQRVASRNDPATRGVLSLAEELGRARHSYQWWDWLLPPKVSEEMLSLSQSLSLGEVSPSDFAKRLDKAAGR